MVSIISSIITIVLGITKLHSKWCEEYTIRFKSIFIGLFGYGYIIDKIPGGFGVRYVRVKYKLNRHRNIFFLGFLFEK